jgi:hypothetical protein
MSLAGSEKALSELYCVIWAPYFKQKFRKSHFISCDGNLQ